jgi:hypothetical protein
MTAIDAALLPEQVPAKVRNPPSRPFATVVVEGRFGVRRRQSFAYSGRSLTRMSAAATPSTPASASPASAPCRTSAGDPAGVADQGFTPPYDISYRGVKLRRLSAALGRSYLRPEPDLPQVGRPSLASR